MPTNAAEAGAHGVYPRYGVRGQRLRKAAGLLPAMGRFRGHLWKERPDIVHFQWPGAIDRRYAAAARRLGARVVYTSHVPVDRTEGDLPHSGWDDDLINLADAVVVHGPALRQRLVDRCPDVAARVAVIEHGNYEHVITRLPRAEARHDLGISQDAHVVAFLGQVRRRKGIEVLIESVARVKEVHPRLQLLIAGTVADEAYEGELRSLTRALGVHPGWITSAVPVSQRALDQVAAAANQIALPFDGASQSGSVILSMNYGRCVVATPGDEVARTIGDRGILVPPRDVSALQTAVRLACEEPEECDRLGARALAHVKARLSWASIGAQTAELYRSIAT